MEFDYDVWEISRLIELAREYIFAKPWNAWS